MNWFQKLGYYLHYLGDPPWDTGISPPELVEFVQTYPPGKAIDLGCGTGTNSIYLAKNKWKVTGVDFVGKAIRTARKKAINAGVEVRFVVDDVTRLAKVDEKFDLILDIGCFHSLSSSGKADYIENLARLLVSGGHYLLYAWLANEDKPDGTGITAAEIHSIGMFCNLISRVDGTEKGWRPSAWFKFQCP